MNEQKLQELAKIIDESQTIVVIQADNPDADSLASALALEQLLHEQGKDPVLYCGVDMPGYLKYLSGWDRVSSEMPHKFDASIIVDASNIALLEKLGNDKMHGWLAAKPCVVLDHHETSDESINFAKVLINDASFSSTAELIYHVARTLDWNVSQTAGEHIISGILGDTQGLTNSLASSRTYRVIADIIDLGVDRAALEEKRRELSKMTKDILLYKAKLIERTEFLLDNKLAIVIVPHDEIITYSPQYNPAPLIQSDLLQTENVGVTIVIKAYDNNRVTGAIRCTNDYPVGAKLAEKLGGGGHEYASGFKVTSGKSAEDVKRECIKILSELLKENELA